MSFLASLSQPLQQRLSTIGAAAHLSDGDQLIRQGDVSTQLYLVEKGGLSALTNDVSVPIGSGEVVGEMAFLDNRPRTATVLARGPVRVRAIEREQCF